jgi:hypothetical protein
MLGHLHIGGCVSQAGLFAASGTPFMMQDIGGSITRARHFRLPDILRLPRPLRPVPLSHPLWDDSQCRVMLK